MLDGRAQEDLNAVTIAWLTFDHNPEFWALLMGARVCIDESPCPIQPDLYIDAIYDYVTRYRIACHCARRGRFWAGLSGEGQAMGLLKCIVENPTPELVHDLQQCVNWHGSSSRHGNGYRVRTNNRQLFSKWIENGPHLGKQSVDGERGGPTGTRW
jgi:hypothetical protein